MAASSVIVGGDLMTRGWDVDAVMRHHNQKQEEATADTHVPPPVYGLLTRTVIETPVVNWVFPARIRHMDKNDVIFIGDNLVQLRELRADGLLRDIAKKSDFGSRIRSALVIGDIPPSDINTSPSKDEDGDTEMAEAPADSSNAKTAPVNGLPPQYVVLALESGDVIFLFVHPQDNTKFVTWKHTVTASMQHVQLGTSLTVDPSARYMSLAYSQNIFVIFELRSPQELAERYNEDESFQPIKREHYMFRNGIIHKMEFLYPSKEDKDCIILLLLAIKASTTTMYVYVWDAGDDIKNIKPENPTGHGVDEHARLPILLIPLRLNSNFLLVSEDRVMLCKNVLEDAPNWNIPQPLTNETSPQHQGIRPPMFSAWARPRRLKSWTYNHDTIYIAREDGLIYFLEIDDEDDTGSVSIAGNVNCNIGKAFACVDFADEEARGNDHVAMSTKMGDILVIGGDLSNGATYLITARQHPRMLEPIHNWSPTPDFIVVPTRIGGTRSRQKGDGLKHADSNGKSPPGSNGRSNGSKPSVHNSALSVPDRIFACSGRGINGSIAELRHGLETRLGHILEYEGYIKQSWVLADASGNGHFFVLSLAEESALLHLSPSPEELTELDHTETWLDLSSSTILAEKNEGWIIQVTEKSINISNAPLQECGQNGYCHVNPPGKTNIEAVMHNKIMYMTTRIDGGSQIEMNFSQIHSDGMTQLGDTTILDYEPTCISLAKLNGTVRGLFATASKPEYLFILDVGGIVQRVPFYPAPQHCNDQEFNEDVCHSIAVIQDGYNQVLLCGFRDGSFRSYIIITKNVTNDGLRSFAKQHLEFSDNGFALLPRDSTQIGTTAVMVAVDPLAPETAFIHCESAIYRFVFDKIEGSAEPSMSSLHRLWHTKDQEPFARQPIVNSVTTFSHEGYGDDVNLLITGHSKLILASLDPNPKPMSRNIALNASPTALFYSEDLHALVIAILLPTPPVLFKQDPSGKRPVKTNILFIDLESGENISKPVDKKRSRVEFVQKLGKNERILSLGEWKFYKEGETFQFILVGTSAGNLLLISARRTNNLDSGKAEIEYVTKYVFERHVPVYSFAVSDDSIFICSGKKVSWETLHLAEKKFKPVASLELPSSGLSMEVHGDLVYIVTARHSVFVAKFSIEENKLFPHLTDQFPRSALQQLDIPHYPLTLLSDRTSSVVGLWYPNNPGFTAAASTVFEAELSTSIFKFQTIATRNKEKKHPAAYVEWFESREDPALSPSQAENVLGIGIDGSLHQFRVLSQPIWIVLKWIQNIAVHSPLLSPFTFDKEKEDELGNYQIEPLPISKSHMSTRHVNGDILARCKSLGAEEFKALLELQLPGDDEFDNSVTRMERFRDLVKECLSPFEREKNWAPHWEAYKLMCSHLLPVL